MSRCFVILFVVAMKLIMLQLTIVAVFPPYNYVLGFFYFYNFDWFSFRFYQRYENSCRKTTMAYRLISTLKFSRHDEIYIYSTILHNWGVRAYYRFDYPNGPSCTLFCLDQWRAHDAGVIKWERVGGSNFSWLNLVAAWTLMDGLFVEEKSLYRGNEEKYFL